MMLTPLAPSRSTAAAARRRAGFTLVEILAVLAILGLLMSMAVFFFGRQKEQGYVAKTRAVMAEIEIQVTKYSTKFGDAPPDRLADLKIRASNELNEGSEALYAALHSKTFTAGDSMRDDVICNTDDDSTPTAYHRDAGVTGLFEVMDGWGNPIAYFHPRDYGREQHYLMGDPPDPEHAEQAVAAAKSKVTGGFASPDKYQLISAGPDRLFGTEDDIVQ